MEDWLKTYLREVFAAHRETPLTKKEWQQVMMDVYRERALRAELARTPPRPKMKLF